MSETAPISKSEEDLLTCLGYMVMKWNYAEWCARQTLRAYVPDTSLNDSGHLKLSARMAKGIEDDLRNIALPRWLGTGRIFLERMIDAYSVARDHRNHYVHGIYSTVGFGSNAPARAVLIPAKPHNGKTQVPSHVSLIDMRPLGDHFHDLAIFAREVMVGFDQHGNRALNPDGTPVLAQLPALLTPLPPCRYETA